MIFHTKNTEYLVCSEAMFTQLCFLAGVYNHTVYFPNGPGYTKTCLMPYANNKGADQPGHPCSLVSTFVVRCLDSMICILAIPKFQDSS